MRKFSKHIILITFLGCLFHLASAQDQNKINVQNPFSQYKSNPTFLTANSGSMSYWGDLANDGITAQAMRPTAGLGIQYYLLPRLSVRADLNIGAIYMHDKWSVFDTHQARNLHFRSNIYEMSTVLVLDVLRNNKMAVPYFMKGGNLISPYFFVGIGMFHFNPQAKHDGQWHNLQPLGTEGQYILNSLTASEIDPSLYPEPYSLNQLAIPFGGGLKLYLSNMMTLGVEANLRKTFTDYLDDVSTVYPDPIDLGNASGKTAVLFSDRVDTNIRPDVKGVGAPRGNPGYKDYYYSFVFNFTYFLNWQKTSK